MNHLDTTVLLWFNHLLGSSHLFDALVLVITKYAPVLFGALFAWYFFRPSPNPRQMRQTVLTAGVSGVVALGVVFILGHMFYHARPFVAIPDQVHLLMPHPPDSSFPSDHGTGSAAFAAGMWFAPDRTARWLFVILAALVAVSRIIAGVHWPSDIVASLILGTLVALVVRWIANQFLLRTR